MAQTFIVKGSVVTDPVQNDFSYAQFVRITATSATTATVTDADSTTLGTVYIAQGESVILEKKNSDKITCANSKASAVGSPRS